MTDASMKAMICTKIGPYNEALALGRSKIPTPDSGEILVKVIFLLPTLIAKVRSMSETGNSRCTVVFFLPHFRLNAVV